MARVTDLINSLGFAEDGVTVAYPDTFRDDMTAAYTEDVSIYDSKIGVQANDLAAKDAEIAALKAHNYDLLMQIPATKPDENPAPSEDEPTEDDDEDEGVESLFGK